MTTTLRRSMILGVIAALGLFVAATASAGVTAKHARAANHMKLVVKSDTEHGKKGADGKWHDAFLPASFTVKKGARVKVTVFNYDDMPHSFTSPSLHVNAIIPAAKGKKAGKKVFTITAKKPGKYLWWCAKPCDPWAMAHVGFMRGYVTVVA